MHLRLPSWTEYWCHTNVTINTKPATHSKMWPIVTDVLWFVCVCWSVSRPWVVLKWLNQSRRRLSAQETMHSVGPGSPEELVILGISPGPLWMSWDRLPRTFHFQVTTLGKLFTHMCLCHQAVQFGSGQRAVMPCGWEGNRRSGHASQTSVVYPALRSRTRHGDEHPAHTLLVQYGPFTLPLPLVLNLLWSTGNISREPKLVALWQQ